jgi:hypothetical protein
MRNPPWRVADGKKNLRAAHGSLHNGTASLKGLIEARAEGCIFGRHFHGGTMIASWTDGGPGGAEFCDPARDPAISGADGRQ